MPSDNSVTIYKHKGFKGGSVELPEGCYNIDYTNVQNDTISSIHIPVGWSVTVYSDRDSRGESRIFRNSVQDLEDFDDRISSIWVRGVNLTMGHIEPLTYYNLDGIYLKSTKP